MQAQKRSKKKTLEAHAKRRFYERHGIKLTPEMNKNLIQQIQNGQAEHLEKQSNRISVFKVQAEEQFIRVVYDRSRKVLVTALPEEDWK